MESQKPSENSSSEPDENVLFEVETSSSSSPLPPRRHLPGLEGCELNPPGDIKCFISYDTSGSATSGDFCSGEEMSTSDTVPNDSTDPQTASQIQEPTSTESFHLNSELSDLQCLGSLDSDKLVSQSSEGSVSRKRPAQENEYFEFDWDDELEAEGAIVVEPSSTDPDEGFGGGSPMHRRHPRYLVSSDGMTSDEVISDLPSSPDCRQRFDIVREQRQSPETFASSLKHKLEKYKHRNVRDVNGYNLPFDLNQRGHKDRCLNEGSFIAIEKNGRIVPCVYFGGTDFCMEVGLLKDRKIGWTYSNCRSIVDRKKFRYVLKYFESLPQPNSKSLCPLKVIMFPEPFL